MDVKNSGGKALLWVSFLAHVKEKQRLILLMLKDQNLLNYKLRLKSETSSSKKKKKKFKAKDTISNL